MAKVVLVWNEHPTEVVAGFHVRKVAEILRKKYGHKVVMEKIPVAETNYGMVRSLRKGATVDDVTHKLLRLKTSLGIAAKAAKKYRTIAFNFHTSPALDLAKATMKAPQEFEVRECHPDEVHMPFPWGSIDAEIIFQRFPRANHFVIELPAEYREMRDEMVQKHRKEILPVFDKIVRLERSQRVRRAESDTNRDYHL
ncbi:hypothetical protein HY571_01975, partial [Candidatus Micrarchaeota archaeon]|nr:hypothetical protein [Candidatus Micrarchaeota archaeon]